MSRQSFEAFIKKLQQDESLRKELRAQLGDPAQGVNAEGFNKFAAAKGYDFKVQEIKDELTDKQLESVAGGLTATQFSFLKLEASTVYFKFDAATNFQKF